MKIKIYYDKTLKLSEGKLAAQCSHVAKELGRMVESDYETDVIIVLGLSHTKFSGMYQMLQGHTEYLHAQIDAGYTEVPQGTMTAFGYIEEV